MIGRADVSFGPKADRAMGSAWLSAAPFQSTRSHGRNADDAITVLGPDIQQRGALGGYQSDPSILSFSLGTEIEGCWPGQHSALKASKNG